MPRLVADIGGTNCRFGLVDEAGGVSPLVHFATSSEHGPVDAIERAIAIGQVRPRACALAVASPVLGDRVRFPNAAWDFSIAETASSIGVPLVVTNDFAAQSYALAVLGDDGTESIGTASVTSTGTRVVLGPGTGLGVGVLVPLGAGFEALPSEGGHMTAAASDDDEAEVLRLAREVHEHVSWERVVSGPGLSLLHDLCARRRGLARGSRSPAEIVADLDDVVCAESIRLFTGLLGTFAADVALTLAATSGVYLTGGVLSHLGARFDPILFRRRFEAKGRYRSILEAIPTVRVVDELAAFRGLAYVLGRVARGERPNGVVVPS